MNKAYSRRNWQNYPSTNTPINETNLNAMDLALDTVDNRVITLDTTKLDKSTANMMVKDVTYNEANGIFTITYLNGVTATLDTKLEKLAVNFAYDAENERLVITLSDGTIQYVDLRALITQYDFTNSSTIAFTLGSDGKVTANIVDGSVTESKLQPNFLADCRTARQGAETASASASNSATDSANKALVAEGYANGTQNGTEVDPSSPYYHNNAKYWKEEARAIAGGGVTSFNGRSGSVVPQSGDYSVEMIEGIDGLNADLEFLGWSVPSECPVQNYKDDEGNFHQKVGRVDLQTVKPFYAYQRDIEPFYYFNTVLPNATSTRNVYNSQGLITYITVAQGLTRLVYRDGTVLADVGEPSGYLYYELAEEIVIPCGLEKFTQSEDDSTNLEFLGYTIPKEMKIRNYKDANGDFHQRIGRVDLGSLSWFYSEEVFSTNSFDIKNYAEQYCTKYEFRSGSSMPEEKQINSVPHFRNNSVNVKDSSYTNTTAFKNSLQGTYLYYELAEEIVIPCGLEKTSDIDKYIGYTEDDIYGVEVDFAQGTFTRLAGAVGKTEGADFNSVQMFGGRRRCNVSDNGTVTAYYGDSAYREDGSNGQVMVEQPKFYYRIVPLKLEKVANGKGFHLRKARYYVSDTMKEGFKIHPAFVKNGVENNFIYLSAYEGSTYDVSESAYNTTDAQTVDFNADKLASIANAKPVSGLTQNLTRANARKIASNRGDGWSQATVQSATATEILFLIEYASFDMQNKVGIGVTNKTDDGTNMSENTGATTSLGNATGVGTNNAISYRGEENFYGNIWKWVDGINIYNYGEGTVHIADHDFEDNKKDGSYQDAGITICGSNGYVSAFAYNEDFDWLFIASECRGNDKLPVGDYFYQNKASNQYTVAKMGGDWNDGPVAGGFCWRVHYASSNRSRGIGTRLLYVPNGSKDNNIVVKGTLTVEASQNSTSAPFGIKSKNSDYSLAEYSNDAKVFGYLGMNSTSEPVVLTPNHEQKKIHHDGNSAKVVISSSAPSDTSALWVVP